MINAGRKGDRISGGPGADRLRGARGGDRVSGGFEADIIYGGLGNDWAYGSLGGDTLFAGTGADHLIGGMGNDSLDALDGVGDDSVRGGAGSDTCSADPGRHHRQLPLSEELLREEGVAALHVGIADPSLRLLADDLAGLGRAPGSGPPDAVRHHPLRVDLPEEQPSRPQRPGQRSWVPRSLARLPER